ncbi:MAG: MBL fold metallo-hydrolase [Clostridia bacterium]|nr:MBL fold metallo-hydrolase [Clostridia bacterium]
MLSIIKGDNPVYTFGRNAVHMLKSVTDTIGDSFIITTSDEKVIVIDGGFRSETDFFLDSLVRITGKEKPFIDGWFLSHAHSDHVEVFFEAIENRRDRVDIGKVYVNLPPVDFYKGIDDDSDMMLHNYQRLRPFFEDGEEVLSEGDTFSIGKAAFEVIYTFDPAFRSCNDSSLVFRMELGGKRFLFTGDNGPKASEKIISDKINHSLLKCDICKMAHHGQDGSVYDFYRIASPSVCLWPTPSWVWDNRNGNLKTLEVRKWISDLGVKENYISKDGTYSLLLD